MLPTRFHIHLHQSPHPVSFLLFLYLSPPSLDVSSAGHLSRSILKSRAVPSACGELQANVRAPDPVLIRKVESRLAGALA